MGYGSKGGGRHGEDGEGGGVGHQLMIRCGMIIRRWCGDTLDHYPWPSKVGVAID